MPGFFSKELFSVDGLRFTVGLLILIVVVYWLLFMRK